MPRYLLDTNVFVHLIRGDATAQRLGTERNLLLADETPVFSVVTEGEIRSLAYQFGWGEDRLRRMLFLLGYFQRLPIDTPEILEAYAVIDAESRRQGISMGKNDAWIAATAHVTGFPLLTTDRDFDRLDRTFLTRILVPIM